MSVGKPELVTGTRKLPMRVLCQPATIRPPDGRAGVRRDGEDEHEQTR